MLKQIQQQKLLQRISPQQILLMNLLQVPTINLEERIVQELQENPALELASDSIQEEDDFDNIKEREEDSLEIDNLDESILEPDNFDSEYSDLDLSEYLNDDSNYNSYNPDNDDDNSRSLPIQFHESFKDILLDQFLMLNLTEQEILIGNQIIGSIEDDGYLRRDSEAIKSDLAFSYALDVSVKEINDVLLLVQNLDPAGVGARTLQECLLLQLKRKEHTPNQILATKILEKYFQKFVNKQYASLKKSLDISSDIKLKEILDEITKLSPKPGIQFTSEESKTNYILPDFFVRHDIKGFDITLNSRNAPELRISSNFRSLLETIEEGSKIDKKQKDTVVFIKQKIDSAKWFIDSIKQRQHTLLDTMRAIIEFQYNFFKSGDDIDLKPMILKDIADITGLDISTISRVVNQKYVETEFGIYRLKYFFSESMTNSDGTEISNIEIKRILEETINNENKSDPLSDIELLEALKEKGYKLARRTVTKYREQLNIPVSRLRKEL